VCTEPKGLNRPGGPRRESPVAGTECSGGRLSAFQQTVGVLQPADTVQGAVRAAATIATGDNDRL